MSNPTWDQLAKNQTDPELLEAAIDRIVAAHEADPTAHLGAGESLAAHKADDMIDHPAGSVAIDKISLSRLLMTSFETTAGWSDYTGGSGSIVQGFGSLTLATGATNASYAGLSAVQSGISGFNSAKDCMWRATLMLAQTTNQSVYFGIGYLVDLVDFNGFGFKISNGTLYAYMGDFTNYVETQITGWTLTNLHTYEIRFNAITPHVDFYIDGELVASFTTGYFPESDDSCGAFIIKNSTAAAKYMYLFNYMYQQDF